MVVIEARRGGGGVDTQEHTHTHTHTHKTTTHHSQCCNVAMCKVELTGLNHKQHNRLLRVDIAITMTC